MLYRLISLKAINDELKNENDELVIKHFSVQDLGALLNKLKRLKNGEENKTLVNLIRSGLRDLKEEIEDMDKYKIEIEKPNEIVDIVEKILEFNNQN